METLAKKGIPVMENISFLIKDLLQFKNNDKQNKKTMRNNRGRKYFYHLNLNQVVLELDLKSGIYKSIEK